MNLQGGALNVFMMVKKTEVLLGDLRLFFALDRDFSVITCVCDTGVRALRKSGARSC